MQYEEAIVQNQLGIRRNIFWHQQQFWLLTILGLVTLGAAGYGYIIYQTTLTTPLLILASVMTGCVFCLCVIIAAQSRVIVQLLQREERYTELRLDLQASNREALAVTLGEFVGGHKRTLRNLDLGEECLPQLRRINERTLCFVAEVTRQHGDMDLSDAVRQFVATALEAEGVEATTENVVTFIKRHSSSIASPGTE